MSPSAKIGITVSTVVVVFAAAALISIQAAGVGHGSYIPMGLFFPFSILAGIVVNGQDWVILSVGLLQYLIYGVLLGRAWLKGAQKKIGLWLGVFHSTAVLIVIAMFLLD